MSLSRQMKDNQDNWNDRAVVHRNSDLYRLERYRTDPNHMSNSVLFDAPRLGDLDGRRVAHLQCHIGTDTITLERLGADAVGLDFAPEAITTARELAKACGSNATFVEANVYDAPQVLDGQFDLVYTSVGTICWLDDLDRWAAAVAGILRPGGELYIRDGHPALWSFEEVDGEIKPTYNYFTTQSSPMVWDTNETYADGDSSLITHTRHHEWNHSLADVVNALVGAGMRIDRMEEHKGIDWEFFSSCELIDGQYFLPEPWRSAIPAMFSLWATLS